MIQFALTANSLTGPANAVTPHPARNADFTKVLARVLHRPAIFPAPAFALRLALGEMADALLLGSQRVLPKKFESLGYKFVLPDLESALRTVLATDSTRRG
jgi:NAD dependent epimerase/dehydratase family enzyme